MERPLTFVRMDGARTAVYRIENAKNSRHVNLRINGVVVDA